MGANRLAFAVGVGRQVDGVRLAGGSLQGLDDFLLGRNCDVVGLEVLVDIHAQVFLGQVHDMPHGGLHGIAGPKIFIDGFGLSRRLDDDERFSHSRLRSHA